MKVPRVLERPVVAQFIRYGVTGLVSLVVYIGLLVLLERHAGTPALVANLVGYSCATVVNYLLNYHWSFASDARHGEAGVKFVAVVLLGLGLNSLFVGVLVSWGVETALAGVTFVALWPLVSFTALKLWAFRG